MQPDDLQNTVKMARQVGQVLAALVEGATEEDIDLSRLARNYPLWGLAFAAGAGAIGGWWFGRRGVAPAPPPPATLADSARGLLENAGDQVRRQIDGILSSEQPAREYMERLLPPGVEPEELVEEVGARARTWLDSVLEPKVREGVESLGANFARSGLGALFSAPKDDVQLEDPDDPQT